MTSTVYYWLLLNKIKSFLAFQILNLLLDSAIKFNVIFNETEQILKTNIYWKWKTFICIKCSRLNGNAFPVSSLYKFAQEINSKQIIIFPVIFQ